MNISVPVGTEVDYVSFSFYEPNEIRKISVKQIVNPVLFDALGHPTKGGLYDPSLGPFQKTQICATCSQDHFNCPGHFGHIEIPIPAYNPMFFDNLYALLRSKCVYCHQFRISRALMKKYTAQLTLLQHGLISQAQALDEIVLDFKKANEAKEDETLEDRMEESSLSLSTAEEYIDYVDNFMKDALADEEARKYAAKDYKVTVINDVRKNVMRNFMKHCIHSKKCGNCHGISPPVRRDGAAKLFQLALNKKDQAVMDRMKESTGSFGELKGFANGQRFLTPYDVRKDVQALFEKEGEITTLLFGARDPRVPSFIKKATYHMFFIEVLAVAPTRFRPPSVMGEKTFESPQNELLSAILKGSHLVRDFSEELQAASQEEPVDKKKLEVTRNRFVDSIINLQHAVNSFIDSTKNPTQVAQGQNLPAGIRQVLEKKEGLFRKHMMGKRVNYAARSVISPDPFIETSEIGIPPVFATKLTYPEPVTPHNIKEMRQAVINGPNKWPGATHVQNEDQSIDVLGDLSIESQGVSSFT
ncbi:hypothetical protein G6F57_006388 [Rhizopus arrhizus]|uniref:DNA-directed RNA polymerase subunit n=1 Tax=Rhizopus oryzae TaxID=64495 RepID=A0A9P6XEB0_RHIOR|nr:hypothetical protein G6F23_002153 [Rhizopus arrhizus]KAG0763477.1 hypothetical protein G6F24_005990 [Rhizopus arrhizus]KAG0778288.1 hypothetical protein G6F22_011319 [Rhizopus arrhizus]KAG0793448.1 hypothetical protein G6F21_003613 [Rhizopus arrhizus]KAG0814612.1 hypothetical protein G6F20_004642 [Rhizopus arrhizus]